MQKQRLTFWTRELTDLMRVTLSAEGYILEAKTQAVTVYVEGERAHERRMQARCIECAA